MQDFGHKEGFRFSHTTTVEKKIEVVDVVLALIFRSHDYQDEVMKIKTLPEEGR